MSETFIRIDENYLQQATAALNVELKVFESIASTNDYLAANRSNKNIQIYIAEQQTKGRGQWGRVWHSPLGKNIYLSCLYTFQKNGTQMGGLSSVASLAVYEVLKDYIDENQLKVKWPNDLLYANQKIAGSLVDVIGDADDRCCAIIGIGVNVNMQAEEQSISQAWTSLKKITGKDVDRNIICEKLIHALLSYLEKFNQLGWSSFVSAWSDADYLFGKMITLESAGRKVSGKVQGINLAGHLRVRLADGAEKTFPSGDATIEKGW